MPTEGNLTASIREQDRKRWWGIHDRDDYICPDCGRTREEIERWNVHHVGKQPHKIVGLCQLCHNVRHGAIRWKNDLEAWKDEFLAIGD